MRPSVGSMILISALAAGCAGFEVPAAMKGEPAIYPPAEFSHRVAASPVVLYWNCVRPEPGVLRLDGVAHNPWSPQEVRFLELELVGVDSQDRAVSEARGEVRDFLLRLNQISPFRIDLAATGAEQRFDLYYEFRFQEGDHRVIAGPPIGGTVPLAQTRRFMARDVCSETQHRIR